MASSRRRRRPAGPAARANGSARNRSRAAAAAETRQLAFSTEAWRMDDCEVEDALLAGDRAAELENYFGPARYQELRQLKRQAAARGTRGGPRVLILPGIMGSKLGVPRGFLLPDDMFWLDPLDVLRGRLAQLTLNAPGGNTKVQAIGVFLSTYLALKLRLQIGGYDADFFPYDWRQDIGALGQRLRDHIKAKEKREVSLVAHSMGGLVARAAVKAGAHVRRLIMLGTPNYGSFSPVQALRATHSSVIKLARLADEEPAKLSRDIFSTFTGLCQMLPSPQRYAATNFFEMAAWPAGRPDRPQPRAAVLEKAAGVQDLLAPGNERFYLIAGVNQSTVVAASLQDGEYVYEQSYLGDGTVPLEFARLAGARTYYIEEQHGSLPNNRTVARAVKELLDSGSTDVLPTEPPPLNRGAVAATTNDARLRAQEPFEGRRGGQLRAVEVRHLADEFAAPDAREDAALAIPGGPSPTAPGIAAVGGDGAGGAGVAAAAAAPGGAGGGRVPRIDPFTVTRNEQHRLELQLYDGSITDIDARAYVVGLFERVAPSGPAAYIDQWLGGAIADFTRRRMFSGAVGEMFMLPAARRRLRAEFVVFAGLGYFDRFGDDVQQLVAENVIRTLIRTRVEDFATVLVGSGSGQPVEQTLYNLISGFIRGLIDSDAGRRFRCVTICETDPDRFERIRQEAFRLSTTPLFDNVEVTFRHAQTEAAAAGTEIDMLAPQRVTAAPGPRGPDPVYLLVRSDDGTGGGGGGGGGGGAFTASVLTAGAKASVVTDTTAGGHAADWKRLLEGIDGLSGGTLGTIDTFGDELARHAIANGPRQILQTMRQNHLVIVHDSGAAKLPWETLRLGDWSPAATTGISRRYMAANLSVAKYLEARRLEGKIEMLLVVNPTEDLPGAEKEGARINELFGRHPAVNLTLLRGDQATRPRLLAEFQSGKYDVLHYAGHAYFDEDHPSRSGILLPEDQVLSGADLTGIGNLPCLVFFNACEAGKIRGGVRSPRLRKVRREDLARQRLERSVGFAEAFLRGGVANYVGTYWPVNDDAATEMARVFYDAVLAGESIGAALTAGRQRLQSSGNKDWANYIHYGSYDFRLKVPQHPPGGASGNGRAAGVTEPTPAPATPSGNGARKSKSKKKRKSTRQARAPRP